MSIQDEHDVTGLRRVGAVVAEVRDALGRSVAPGVSTAVLDAIAAEIFQRHGARSAPKRAYDFPGHTCISVNDALAHGVPSRSNVLREGDVVNIDVSAELDGYWADTGASYPVGRVSPRREALLQATREALAAALAEVRAGRPLRNIGRAVERRAARGGFRVIRNIGGHGVGRYIHEKPSVSNTYDPHDQTVLRHGWVIAVEPFLTTRAREVIEDADGWTLRTPDGSVGAQFEHTVIVTHADPIVITQ